ncbi:hypothetical protein JCM10213v2_008021 [Rhodosporidiobolus nylandii]
MATKLLPLAVAGGGLYFFEPLRQQLNTITQRSALSGWLLAASIAVAGLSAFAGQLVVALTFAWNCFLRPLGASKDQKGRLDSFYQGQAGIYDKTRAKLLRGRTTMLRLSAARLKEQRRKNPNKRLVWVDIGGGTGWNVEEMDKYFPIKDFDAVYLIDLCEPLLEVSRRRFAARGWKNVHCLLQDATQFVLPEWTGEGVDVEGGIDFCTMSYSLSMMPDFMTLLDRVDRFLNPSGLFSVCDFYVSERSTTSMAGVIGEVASRQCSYWSRLFWLNWFALDHVDLHPSRRQYLEHRFATIKSFNARNHFLNLPLVRIPYYVSLHASRRFDTSKAHQFYEQDAKTTLSASPSPMLMPSKLNRQNSLTDIPDLALGVSAALSRSRSTSNKPLKRSDSRSSDKSDSFRIDIAPEIQLSAFHFGLTHRRVPYIDQPVHRDFRSWIYSFTWEDPRVDLEHLDMDETSDVLCIASGGENALHYAIEGKPHRIHAVDFNPCQGHLVELKLAAIQALDYEDLFGEGRHENFRELLDNRLSPFLTSHAYSFWRKNDQASGHALRIASWALWLAGVSNSTAKMCSASTLGEQRSLWERKLRPVLLSRFMTKLVLANPVFLWNALGVPINQLKVFLKDTTVAQFATDTFDPVALNTHIAKDNYFYQLCLQQRYTHDSCPAYLTPEGFAALKKDNCAALDCFRLHTDSIQNVMTRLGPSSLSIAIIMDLQDWFPDTVTGLPLPSPSAKPCELTATIRALHTALKPNGRVFFRSAGLEPWYLEIYRREGFEVEYASFYKCTKK